LNITIQDTLKAWREQLRERKAQFARRPNPVE
jgi:hypothetical protein